MSCEKRPGSALPLAKPLSLDRSQNEAKAPRALRGLNKLRDEMGFRMKQQYVDKTHLEATGEGSKTIEEEETEGASYSIHNHLRRVTPYYFTYLTYCKLRWRDRSLIDIFTEEFRDKEPDHYKKAIAEGKVMLNKKPSTLDSKVRNGDLISHRCHRHEPAVTSRPLKVVFENDHIIAINKPSGIPVHPAGRYRYNTITKIMQHEMGITVHPCNRLDRLTLGLMFLGKNAKGAEGFVKQIRERSVKKEYIARVKGKFPLGVLKVDEPLHTASPKHALNVVDRKNGKHALTEFVRVSYDPVSDTSIVKCHPFTGRSHQIRVHLQYIGHPIANDPLYLSQYIWGDSNLGQGNVGLEDPSIVDRLDTIGKTRACSTWIHPNEDGEVLSEERCAECDVALYTDPGPNDLDLWLHAFKYEDADKKWCYQTEYPEWALEPSRRFMMLALEKAKQCGETQTQYNVGAVLVLDGQVLETGHSRELPGNTHAEQCALEKYFSKVGKRLLPEGTELYTTMEPCSLRLSGNLPCVERILESGIKTCFVGVVEPDTFVKNNEGKSKLSEAGVEYVHIPGYEEECLRVATLGHDKIQN